VPDPRPETELLLEQALLRLPRDAPARVADLGTGSGALALALASARPHAYVLATDASMAALTRARANARRLGLARRVRFAEGDWCAALGAERFAMLVSNPPYLADDDAHLQQGDLRFEPRMALAAGVDGLDALRVIIHAAPEHLHARGWLLLEHGAEQGPGCAHCSPRAVSSRCAVCATCRRTSASPWGNGRMRRHNARPQHIGASRERSPA